MKYEKMPTGNLHLNSDVDIDLTFAHLNDCQTGDAATALKVKSLRVLIRAMFSIIEKMPTPNINALGSNRSRRAGGMLARRIYDERARRSQYFPSKLFGEPAWDILLDLFAAAQCGEARAIKEVCIASNAPDATALRYVDQLVAQGLVERRPDKTDSRRKYLRLTALGQSSMLGYLGTMPALDDEAEDLVTDMVNRMM